MRTLYWLNIWCTWFTVTSRQRRGVLVIMQFWRKEGNPGRTLKLRL